MHDSPPAQVRPIQPDLLGPLEETGPPVREGTLFPGDAHWFPAREIRRREEVWRTLASRVDAVCAPDERVLFFARASRAMTLGMYLGLGWYSQRYHQVSLVLTDRRLVEILHDFSGKNLEPCTRSFPWSAVRSIKTGVGGLVVAGPDGKRTRWVLRSRGDKRALKILAPRIGQRLLGAGGERPASFPVEHCPSCYAVKPDIEGPCAGCGSLVRSPRLATTLSLAIPGGGLAYVGHPVLATFDCIGEAMILLFIAVALAGAGARSEIVTAAGVGSFLILMTKLESIHVSRLLAARRRPEDAARRARFRRLLPVGTAVSVLALAGAALLTGRFVDRIDHDLDFATAEESGWTGSHDAKQWAYDDGDPGLRSEWTHQSGLVVSVFGISGISEPELATLQRDYVEEKRRAGTLLDGATTLPAGFEGFRTLESLVGENGEPLVMVNYFVIDEPGTDVHQMYAFATPPETAWADGMLASLLEHGRWIDPIEPRPGS